MGQSFFPIAGSLFQDLFCETNHRNPIGFVYDLHNTILCADKLRTIFSHVIGAR